jgi:hypothetical protein
MKKILFLCTIFIASQSVANQGIVAQYINWVGEFNVYQKSLLQSDAIDPKILEQQVAQHHIIAYIIAPAIGIAIAMALLAADAARLD